MGRLVLFLALIVSMSASAQDIRFLKSLEPTEEKFENIHVLPLESDSLQSSFVIWVKKGVKEHYHAKHTENIFVIDGKAKMTIGNKTISIRKGDFLCIPMGTHHSVTEVTSKRPLKVLSIQSPKFTGKDRVFVKK